jgi:DNA invertase Pin-like site-specific DNA recombinase
MFARSALFGGGELRSACGWPPLPALLRGFLDTGNLSMAIVIGLLLDQWRSTPMPPRRRRLAAALDTTEFARAAQYLRMSTEHQKYSTENQALVIGAYAVQHNISIVRSYIDKARTGISASRRHALKQLLYDIKTGQADYDLVLVYDVSRWGRFLDADESAYYEFICKQAGIRVLYCAEEFENDNGLVSTIVKNIKRAMASEFSRELSVKVHAGQIRLVSLGFRQGGPPGYALRRELVDENGSSRGQLTHGQRKAIQTDRVILKPGPAEEQDLVRRIFRAFAVERKCESRIARELKAEGITNQYGRPWTSWAIRYLLRNENYIGNNVYNRMNFRLGAKPKQNPPHLWVRSHAAFEPIVDPDIFRQAQQIVARRRLVLSDEDLLKRLQALLEEKGKLTATLIDKAYALPCKEVYSDRFGSLREAYARIGYASENLRYNDGRRAVTAVIVEVREEIVDRLETAGFSVAFDEVKGAVTIEGAAAVAIVVARCHLVRDKKFPRWMIGRPVDPRNDLAIVVRMDEDNDGILEYYVLPPAKLHGTTLVLKEKHPANVSAYRCETLDDAITSIRRRTKIKPSRPRRSKRPSEAKKSPMQSTGIADPESRGTGRRRTATRRRSS